MRPNSLLVLLGGWWGRGGRLRAPPAVGGAPGARARVRAGEPRSGSGPVRGPGGRHALKCVGSGAWCIRGWCIRQVVHKSFFATVALLRLPLRPRLRPRRGTGTRGAQHAAAAPHCCRPERRRTVVKPRATTAACLNLGGAVQTCVCSCAGGWEWVCGAAVAWEPPPEPGRHGSARKGVVPFLLYFIFVYNVFPFHL